MPGLERNHQKNGHVRRPSDLHLTAWLTGLLMALWASAGMAAPDVRVDITGVKDEMLDNVRAFLGIYQQRKDPTLHETRIRRLHRRAPQEIAKALEPFGYYQPKVDAQLTPEGDDWRAIYRIDPGAPVRVSAVDLRITGEGEDDPDLKRAARDFPLHVGDVLVHARYEQGKAALQRISAENGYLDADLKENVVRLTLAERTAQVVLHLDTGPRYHFGEVNFPPVDLEPDLLKRFVPFQPGDPFYTRQLLQLQSNLIDSNYFQNVEVQPRRDLARDRRVPVDVALSLRQKSLYTAGVGYGTDTGARGKLAWENRRINERGHWLRTELQLSEIRESLVGRYSIPIRDPLTNQIAFTAGWINDHPDRKDTLPSETLTVGVSRTITRASAWLETAYLNYELSRFTNEDQDAAGNVVRNKEESKLLLPGITWSRVLAANRIFARRGIRLLLDVRGTHTALTSTTQFMQVRGSTKAIQDVWDGGRIILRGDVGATRLERLSKLPPSMRFFAGGDQSVRGYDYNSLGPRDGRNRPEGGQQLLVGSAELEQRIAEKWSVAVFYDIGNALNNWQDSLKAGAGLGARWHSPVGQVRVDLAWPLSEDEGGLKLHLNIGPDL